MNLNAACPWWLAIAIAGTIAALAWNRRSLRADGAVAALIVGTVSLHAHVGWGVLLVLWFVFATLLSRLGGSRKARRVSSIVEKGARRDAWQVLANGGVFALASIVEIGRVEGAFGLATSVGSATLAVAAAASLAASGADTWSTEIGVLYGGTPWSLRTRAAVPAGTSGAVTLTGSIGGALGAVLIAALAALTAVIAPLEIFAVFIGGVAGATVDTMIGAFVQDRRHCPRCALDTERMVHDCGTPTMHHGGTVRVDNDVVNAMCACAGALTAVAAARVLL